MDTKDYFTLSISILAFIFSAITTIITLRQKKFETQRTVRNQLTDVMGKLNAISAEETKFRRENSGVITDPNNQAVFILLNDQRSFLARQAEYLMEQIPNLVSDIEYSTVAVAFRAVTDYTKSNEYWEKAIQAAPDDFYKAIDLRGYARTLFAQGNYTEGRNMYQKSLASLPPDSYRNLRFTGETLERWASLEVEALFFENATKLLNEARTMYEKIETVTLRQRALKHLDVATSAIVNRHTPVMKKDAVSDVIPRPKENNRV